MKKQIVGECIEKIQLSQSQPEILLQVMTRSSWKKKKENQLNS